MSYCTPCLNCRYKCKMKYVEFAVKKMLYVALFRMALLAI